MSAVLFAALVLASWLALSPQGSLRRRTRTALPPDPMQQGRVQHGYGPVEPFPGHRLLGRIRPGWTRRDTEYVPITVMVQQLAALLKAGRAPARLWDELWLLYARDTVPGTSAERLRAPALAPVSAALLAAARTAALSGSPVAEAIRGTGAGMKSGGWRAETATDSRERRVWAQLAACFDVAEASGCPLADVLARFAAQLEAEEDAEAARQTALAGPRATARLLGWLPLLGLGLGMVLGVDPVRVLLETAHGRTAFALGFILSAAGRIWSARLVRGAAGTE